MRALITGSSGRLGRELVRQLRAGHRTVAVDVAPGRPADQVAGVADRDLNCHPRHNFGELPREPDDEGCRGSGPSAGYASDRPSPGAWRASRATGKSTRSSRCW